MPFLTVDVERALPEYKYGRELLWFFSICTYILILLSTCQLLGLSARKKALGKKKKVLIS